MDGSDLMAGLLGEDEDEAQLLYDSEEDIAAPSEQVPVAAANLDYHPSGPAFILPCGACGTPRPKTHTCPGCAVHMCTAQPGHVWVLGLGVPQAPHGRMNAGPDG